jgi:Flp pilus assembly protein TadD
VFLGAVTDPAAIRAYVERYLGPAISVRSVEAEGPVLRASVETSAFQVESQNMVRIGKSLAARGRPRAAADTFLEALKLDPLNVDALKGHAAILAAQNELAYAEEAWVRAGEVRGYDGEILRGLATIALREDRRPTATQYLEEALLLNPDDADAHAMLDELRRQTELRFNDPPASGGAPTPRR